MKLILLIDNYDSFTYNLVDYLGQLGVVCHIVRNDVPLAEIQELPINGLMLSPGPGVPAQAGNLMAILEHFYQRVPVLGICLGQQAIGEFFGGRLVKARKPMHGKVSRINCTEDLLFEGIPLQFEVVRYHSLVLDKLPAVLKPLAFTQEEEVMALRHLHWPVWGVQFHPEAILSEFGLNLLGNWLKITSEFIDRKPMVTC
ncbi:aminodeoxychorismate/anthranilate synthase component II [Rapidithrix thailandica]|uniref:Aminodeoxychorismate/anthranilate synthase component II n=1 Tax=Rapidithrix thailandica TaxID=413964 RepID=A0AAW9RTT6_9BACT